MASHDIDARIALGTMVLTLAVAIGAAVQGTVVAGFLLFIAAATPLPATVAMRAGRWLRACRGTRERRPLSQGQRGSSR
ncbi:MAG: hypothetical protein BroJett026_31060 [Betaproteobacteria bacterium]|nr:MAG: hypothetical protein BroJett026_31060 [Betaproteobacteria bacterium]